MKYIHYGHKTFEPDRFQKVENQLGIPKPNGGLWASPIETEYGWKEWNANKNIGASFEEYFMFTLKKDAPIFLFAFHSFQPYSVSIGLAHRPPLGLGIPN